MSRLAWLLAPSMDSVAFALRLCIAMAVALYLSMWLELDRPYWASLEVAVMIQPMPGMAVVRGFARAAGTVVAGCAGLLIVALFQQSYELSAAGLAIWIAFCAFGANLLRNNLSYGFAIAGFIAGVTVILSHTIDQPPFEIAVARVSECVLAAITVAAVNVLLSPPKTARAYRTSRLALLSGIGSEYRRLAEQAGHDETSTGQSENENENADPHAVLQDLAAQALALEQTRQYVSYESPGFSHFSRMARRLDYDVLSLVSAASSLHVYLAARPGRLDTRALADLARPARCLEDDPSDWQRAKQAFDDAHAAILARARQAAESGQRSLADWVVISRALDLAGRGRAAMIKHGMLLAEQADDNARESTRRSEFGHPMDIKNAARNALRTLTAVGLGGLVWINFHDQLPAVLLMILLAALTTIFATLPNPVAAAGGFAKGLAAASICAFVVDFLILPQATGFAMLMLAMLPFVFVGGLAMTDPDLALPGRIGVVMFSLLVHVQNGTLPSFTTYFQIAMGIFGAIGLTVLAFRIVLPVAPRQRLREQMYGVFDEMARGRRQTRERFETRMYDRLNNLALAEVENEDETQRFSAHQAVLAAINIGLEARALVVLAERVSFAPEVGQAIDEEMTHLRGQFAGRRPALETVLESQRRTHRLAQRMIEAARDIADTAERRLAIRAAVSAELMASALADYVLAFGVIERRHIQLGDADIDTHELAADDHTSVG